VAARAARPRKGRPATGCAAVERRVQAPVAVPPTGLRTPRPRFWVNACGPRQT
jgi:hypothetical protein